MSDLVGNPEDRFSHNEAHMTLSPLVESYHFELRIKEFVLLRRAISLKVNYEKVNFSNCVFFAITFSDYEWTYM